MKIFALAAAGIFAATTAMADGHSAADCASMLTAAVGAELSSQGVDTSNICSLSLGQVAQIKGLLDDGSMNSETIGRINKILGN